MYRYGTFVQIALMTDFIPSLLFCTVPYRTVPYGTVVDQISAEQHMVGAKTVRWGIQYQYSSVRTGTVQVPAVFSPSSSFLHSVQEFGIFYSIDCGTSTSTSTGTYRESRQTTLLHLRGTNHRCQKQREQEHQPHSYRTSSRTPTFTDFDWFVPYRSEREQILVGKRNEVPRMRIVR